MRHLLYADCAFVCVCVCVCICGHTVIQVESISFSSKEESGSAVNQHSIATCAALSISINSMWQAWPQVKGPWEWGQKKLGNIVRTCHGIVRHWDMLAPSENQAPVTITTKITTYSTKDETTKVELSWTNHRHCKVHSNNAIYSRDTDAWRTKVCRIWLHDDDLLCKKAQL